MNRIKIAKQLIKLAKQLIEDKSNLLNDTNIKRQLEKIHIKDYQAFRKIHSGEWISFPINRNANLPDIYVKFDDGKINVGYNYLDDNEIDYHAPKQESLTGMLEELAMIKNKINEILVNIKNEDLSIQENEKPQEEEADQISDEELDLDTPVQEESLEQDLG